MWLKLRKTTSRGRAAMPSTWWRMRRCRRFRRAFRSSRFSIAALLALHLAGAGGGPSRLARFELDPFAGVADALALVGIGRPHRAYARRHLADQFAVEGDPLGRGNLHRVRVADGERQVVPLLGGTVAHALDLQLYPVPVRDAAHHVGQQCPGEAVQGTVLPLVRGPCHDQLPILQSDVHVRVKGALQLPLRALHRDVRALHLDFNAFGDGHGHPPYPRHRLLLSRRPPVLPDIGDHFSADALPPGLPVGHQAARGGEDRHPQPAAHPRDRRAPAVDAQPRAAHPADAREHGFPPWAVAQRDAQDPLRAALDALRVGDEALLLENARDLPLQPAPRHLDVVLPRRVRVANARQHVRDRICDYAAHYCLLAGITSWT